MLVSKRVEAINKEQHNKLSVKCACVCFSIHTLSVGLMRARGDITEHLISCHSIIFISPL